MTGKRLAQIIATHAAAIYFGAGLFAGSMLHTAIPALNAVGVSYIALTWPSMIYCAPVARSCSAVPSPETSQYMFSFPAPASEGR